MTEARKRRLIPFLAFLGLVLAFVMSAAVAVAAEGEGAAALKAKHEELRSRLASSPFGRPLVLVSSEEGRKLKGDVYAELAYPFATVAAGFREAPNWCHVLILPFNTKHCAAEGSTLTVRVGRKSSQPAEDAYRLDFKYSAAAQASDYMRTVLNADSGPIGTRTYQIVLEATPLDAGRTFIHLSYSYGYGAMSQMMMQAYLSTAGSDKVGFTVTGKNDQGQAAYCGGMLGALERNTMRYFLAIDAYLGSLSAPEDKRVEKRLNDWFAATERYPRQLHEMSRSEYLAMKQKESKRVNTPLG